MKALVLFVLFTVANLATAADRKNPVIVPQMQDDVVLSIGSHELIILKESYDNIADEYFVNNYDQMCEAKFVEETDEAIIFHFEVLPSSSEYSECEFEIGTDFMRKRVIGIFDSGL